MKVTIKGGALNGKITSVPSKSAGHRALICAAISEKPTKIRLTQSNEDIDTTAECLRAMGAGITREGEYLYVNPIRNVPDSADLRCGESGSTLRFLLPLAASILPRAVFSGRGRLPERPIGDLQEAMKRNGALFSGNALPFSVSGKLRAGTYEIPGDVSSQYISGLLMALPMLNGESRIELKGQLCSSHYVDITIEMLSIFGIEIKRTENGFSVSGNQTYKSPGSMEVEGDWSSASFFLVGGAVGGDVTVSGLRLDSKQGDRAVAEIIRKFGADVLVSENSVRVSPAPLRACEIDVSQIPDLFPILAVLAAKAEGKTVLYNAANLRLKESDRIKSTAEMINSLGGNAIEYPDRLEIIGTALKGGEVDSFGDHRIAMSAAVAASICERETTIYDAGAVKKSYPKFFSDYSVLGGKVIF